MIFFFPDYEYTLFFVLMNDNTTGFTTSLYVEISTEKPTFLLHMKVT